MLDVGAEAGVTALAAPAEWGEIPSRAEVPRDLEGYFNREGPTPSCLDESRALHRFYLRQRAVLEADGKLHAGYTRDVSRSGMGLISPVQLFPLEEVQIWLPERAAINLRVVRCERLDDRCYACGAVFVGGGKTAS